MARRAPAAEAILRLLNHWAFQFNSRRRFHECGKWSENIKVAIQANRAVEIMIPAFFVIANPIKRIDGHAITAAEDVSLLHLANLARFIKQIHSPGLVIHIVSDSNFYALPLGLTAVEAQRYFHQLRCRVCELKIDEALKVHDMVDLLLDHASLFRDRFAYWRATYLNDPLCDGISATEYIRWQSTWIRVPAALKLA
jgi:pyoverdine/dityrosine biosynthesis protein Dit1